jgi:D-alanyl-lipoteichoic acid acyltransferase DltB (MBOAT superfamily)
MLFNSFEYILFLVVAFLGFWGLARLRLLRVLFLLTASYLFYMAWNATFVLLIVASTVVDYLVGQTLGRTDDQKRRKALLLLSLFFNLGLLGLFKYADFGISAVCAAAGQLGLELTPHYLRLVLPVGISFYTFQSLSYTIDVYRRRIEPTNNLWEFATYVAFFPQLVAGPIVRAKEFLPQFKATPRLNLHQAGEGVFLFLWGLFKKVVIADYLAANFIDRVFDNPAGFSSGEAWLAAYGYTWQLYADFSGYTDMARGSAKLFGFELPENFQRPLTATGPLEFWRRWHMTLGRWVQDYLYFPLGGSQRGRARTYFNLFIVFFAVGLWHGAGWAYVLFGLMQGLGVMFNRMWRDYRGITQPPPFGAKAIGLAAANMLFFTIAWTLFRPESVDQMFALQSQMLAGEWLPLRIGTWAWVILIGMPILHFTPPRWWQQIQRSFVGLPAVSQAGVVLAIVALVVYVGGRQPAPFVYFQF